MWVIFILVLSALLNSCGNDQTPNVQYAPPASPDWASVVPIIQKDCGGCHNGTKEPAFTSANFKSSSAAAKLKSGAMPPPPKTISDEDKAKLLAYLGG